MSRHDFRPCHLAVCFFLLVAGCPMQPTDNGNTTDNSNSTDASAFPFLDQDGNFDFSSATALSLTPANNELRFSGSITGDGDTDIYSLGTLSPGDRLFIDVTRSSGNLDAVAAVFDQNQEIQFYNDDRDQSGQDVNPQIDDIIRGPQGTYFLGISPFFGSGTTGDYHVVVQITRGAGVPATTGQIVFLNWKGGTGVVIRNVGTFDLPPFDASQLGPYGPRTADMKKRIQQVVADRYKGFELTLLNSDDNPEPADPHSTIFFGGNNRNAFAISEQIDTMDEDKSDKSIIFTEAFAEAFSPPPSFDEMATAVGNTVAHEIGHLLGLVHTADPNDEMDTTGANERLLQPQKFGTAPLDQTVFSTGIQDSVDLIGWAIGVVGV